MIIVYKSNTGYTKQYAKMLGKALSLPSYELGNVPECHKGSDVIYLGWLFAGTIVGYKKCAKRYKVKCVAGVGMGPPSIDLADGLRNTSLRPCVLSPGRLRHQQAKRPVQTHHENQVQGNSRQAQCQGRAQRRRAHNLGNDAGFRQRSLPGEPGRDNRLVQINLTRKYTQAAETSAACFLFSSRAEYKCIKPIYEDISKSSSHPLKQLNFLKEEQRSERAMTIVPKEKSSSQAIHCLRRRGAGMGT